MLTEDGVCKKSNCYQSLLGSSYQLEIFAPIGPLVSHTGVVALTEMWYCKDLLIVWNVIPHAAWAETFFVPCPILRRSRDHVFAALIIFWRPVCFHQMFVVVLNIKTDIGPGSEEQMKNNDRSTVVSVSSLSLSHTHSHPSTPMHAPTPKQTQTPFHIHIHSNSTAFTLSYEHSLIQTSIHRWTHLLAHIHKLSL